MISTLVFDHDDMPGLLEQAYPNSTRANRERYAKPLLESALKWQINTPLRFSHWLAQLGHESGELKYSEEIASGRAYEWRKDLGNTNAGDGVKHKGYGPIQITGKYNQTKYFKYIGRPELINTPSVIATNPAMGADAAGWFWVYGTSVDLNRVADKDSITLITKLINGGYNGLADRKRLLTLCKRAVDKQGTLKLQKTLNALSARGSRWPALVPDGAFGPQTASVVREMQAEYAFKPTGDVDLKTWNKLKELSE
jgi:predicted chitinase